MSIAALKRVTLCGPLHEKQCILEGLQSLGCMHLIPLRKQSQEAHDLPSAQTKNAYRALKFLRDCRQKRRQIKHDENFSFGDCIDRVLQIQQEIRNVSDRRDFLSERIQSMLPWGDFKLPPEECLAGYKLWFYVVPLAEKRDLPQAGTVWQVVHTDNRFAYVVVISRAEPDSALMPVTRTHTGTESLSRLQNRLNTTELELEDLQAERQSMTRWIWMISQNLARSEDDSRRLDAAQETMDMDPVFAVQGWIPAGKLKELIHHAKTENLALFSEDPKVSDRPPTLLNNAPIIKSGERLVTFYQTPGYWEWDPTIPVFFSFSVFFAMILSDAGYAALLGFVLAFCWRKIPALAEPDWRPLALCLVSVSLIWGILIGGYLGRSPAEDSLLAQFKVFEINDFTAMMRLSIGIGVLHLSFANGARIWRLQFHGSQTVVSMGWILILFGGYSIYLSETLIDPPNWLNSTGLIQLITGISLVFCCAGQRPINNASDLLIRLFEGVCELSLVTKIFGDVLSYLRLFALGLASASLALTFNGLAQDVRESVHGPGLFLSLLVLIIGHGLNLMLSLMSAVVHGMRLNCIEFFNWGLVDEGSLFNAFAKREMSE